MKITLKPQVPPPVPKPDVVFELTWQEAREMRAMAYEAKGEFSTDVYCALNDVLSANGDAH